MERIARRLMSFLMCLAIIAIPVFALDDNPTNPEYSINDIRNRSQAYAIFTYWDIKEKLDKNDYGGMFIDENGNLNILYSKMH